MSDQDTPSIVDDIVDPADQPSSTPPAAPVAPDYSASLAGIVNQDGAQKFSKVEDALASIPHANAHIAALEAEAVQLRETAAKTEAAQEILDRLSAKQDPVTPPVTQALDDASIANAVDAALTAREKAALVKSNRNQVANKMLEKFGDKAQVDAAMAAKATELGVGVDFMLSMASQSPTAVLHHFGIDTTLTVPSVQKLKGSVTPETFGEKGEAPRKNIMYGASSAEVKAEWNRHKPQT